MHRLRRGFGRRDDREQIMNTVFCTTLFYLGGTINTVGLPIGSEVVSAGLDNGQPQVCAVAPADPRGLPDALMFPRTDLTARRFVMVPQGYSVPETYAYVATFTHTDGFLWSIFEVTP
jgi:hypothetical protein